jgi:hypothetical protein
MLNVQDGIAPFILDVCDAVLQRLSAASSGDGGMPRLGKSQLGEGSHFSQRRL